MYNYIYIHTYMSSAIVDAWLLLLPSDLLTQFLRADLDGRLWRGLPDSIHNAASPLPPALRLPCRLLYLMLSGVCRFNPGGLGVARGV